MRVIGTCALVVLPTLGGLACAPRPRADGSVGLYRIVASSNPRFTERVIQMLRSQVYEPPLLNGSPVAVRGEVSFQSTRTR
jgi:hypothetical protein